MKECVGYECCPYTPSEKLLKAMRDDAYEQGKADALDIDEDSVRFTDEQKAWVKKYIIRNGQANYERGTREFAEWFAESSKVSEPIKEYTINRWIEDFNEWKKEVNNA